MMHKVKVVKLQFSYYGDYEESYILQPKFQDWDEVDDATLAKLREGVIYANYKEHKYVLVMYSGNTQEEMFKDAQDFIDVQEKQRVKAAAEAEARKNKALASAVEKKRKQLEKLKKELGEN